MRSRPTFTFAATALLVALQACSSTPSPNESLQAVDDLNARIQKMHVESELAQRFIRDCAESFATLTDSNTKADPKRIFTAFQRSITASENQLQTFKTQIELVETASRPVFDKWRTDVEAIAKPSLRLKSESRLDKARARYLDMIEDAKRAATGFELFNQEVKDIALFLGNDFNASALGQLDAEAKSVDDLGADLDSRLTETMLSAQVYLQNAGSEVQRLPDEPESESVPAGPIGPLPAGPSAGR